MPSPETNVVQSVTRAIQYTGSNSADIDSQVPGVSITSEVGGVLTLNSGAIVLNTGDWILFNSFQTFGLPNTLYHNEWGCVALCDELQEVADDLSTLSAVPAVRSIGVAPVPTLIASASTTVSVTLNPAMSGSGYSAVATLFAGINIAALTINSVTVVDADTVDVVVQNTGLVSLSGSNVMVVASE